MIELDIDDLESSSPIVSPEVFGDAASGIEHELSELIIDIKLAGDYTEDDAIIYAVGLTARCNTLQTYLYAHFDQLINQKKMKDYAQTINQE